MHDRPGCRAEGTDEVGERGQNRAGAWDRAGHAVQEVHLRVDWQQATAVPRRRQMRIDLATGLPRGERLNDRDLVEAVVCLANGAGGVLLVGVEVLASSPGDPQPR